MNLVLPAKQMLLCLTVELIAFSELKNDMQSALSDAAKGGNVFNEKLPRTRNLLEKSDGILQKVLEVVKTKIDNEKR